VSAADEHIEYLTTGQVAERMGIKEKSVRQTLWRGLMPEPDLIMFGRNLWLTETIDRWLKTRGKKRKRKRTRRERLHAAPRRTVLPKNARIARSTAPAVPLELSTVNVETAKLVAAQLRGDGHYCTIRDVQELAVADPHELDYEARKMQQRVQRKLRGLKSRS